jgi:hypothetical protein
MKHELKRISRESVVAYSKVLSRYCRGISADSHNIFSQDVQISPTKFEQIISRIKVTIFITWVKVYSAQRTSSCLKMVHPLYPLHISQWLNKNQIKSTAKNMIAARNATDAHAQDFVANDNLLLPIMKASAQCTRSQNLYLKDLMFSVCV